MGELVLLNCCPRCGWLLNQDRPALNPVSRIKHNGDAYYICQDCGNAEAMFNMFWPDKELPPITEQILT